MEAPSDFYDPKTIDTTDRTNLDQDEYYVEKVIKKRIGPTYKTEYQVKWVGYPSSANTWEKIGNVAKSAEFVKEFEEEVLKTAGTKRAKKVPTAENLRRSMIDQQINRLMKKQEDIQDVIGFIPSASKFIVLWKSGYTVEVPSTYINRLSYDKKKLFMDCLSKMQSQYVEHNKLKADSERMINNLKKIQVNKSADSEETKGRMEVDGGSYKDETTNNTDECSEEDTDEDELSDTYEVCFDEPCLQLYQNEPTLRERNLCRTFLERHYNNEENSSEDEESESEEDGDEEENEVEHFAASAAVDNDFESEEEIIFPQEALFPNVMPSSYDQTSTHSSNQSKRPPFPELPHFEMGPSTSSGSKGIGLPSYIDIKRLTAATDSDSD